MNEPLEALWIVAGAAALWGARALWVARRPHVRHKSGIPIGERQRKAKREREWREQTNRRRRKR